MDVMKSELVTTLYYRTTIIFSATYGQITLLSRKNFMSESKRSSLEINIDVEYCCQLKKIKINKQTKSKQDSTFK